MTNTSPHAECSPPAETWTPCVRCRPASPEAVRAHAAKCDGSLWVTYHNADRTNGRTIADKSAVCDKCGEVHHVERVDLSKPVMPENRVFVRGHDVTVSEYEAWCALPWWRRMVTAP
jgi:hypothetical protein